MLVTCFLLLKHQVLPSSESRALAQHIVIDHRIKARQLEWWQNQGSSIANREDLHCVMQQNVVSICVA